MPTSADIPDYSEPGAVDFSVVVPAYNEETRLGRTLEQLVENLSARPMTCEIIVVDDGSRDGTADLARAVGGMVSVIRYTPNYGKGHAIRRGMLAARGTVACFMDADLSTDLEAVDRALQEIGAGWDVVIGSRALDSSKILVHQPGYREKAAKVFNLIQHRLAGVTGYGDTQCGFKVMTGAAAKAIFTRSSVDGFMFDVEMLFLAERLGYRVIEMPVIWSNDPASRLRIVSDTIRMFRDLIRIRWAGRDLPAPKHRGPARSALPAVK